MFSGLVVAGSLDACTGTESAVWTDDDNEDSAVTPLSDRPPLANGTGDEEDEEEVDDVDAISASNR